MVMGGARTNDGLNVVIVFWPRDEVHAVRADADRSFYDALAFAPPLAERLATGERADRFYGIGDLPFYYRKPYGPGWALVGDAGYHKDPITAQGITDAFRDAELLADYERRRNEETRGLYQLTYEFASLAPPTVEQRTLFGALRTNKEDTNRFFGVVAGTVRPDEFFAPENLGRIVGAPVPA